MTQDSTKQAKKVLSMKTFNAAGFGRSSLPMQIALQRPVSASRIRLWRHESQGLWRPISEWGKHSLCYDKPSCECGCLKEEILVLNFQHLIPEIKGCLLCEFLRAHGPLITSRADKLIHRFRFFAYFSVNSLIQQSFHVYTDRIIIYFHIQYSFSGGQDLPWHWQSSYVAIYLGSQLAIRCV